MKSQQHLFLGAAVVTLGAGLRVTNVITGFETCRMRIHGLPQGIQLSDLQDLMDTLDVPREMFVVTSMRDGQADIVISVSLKDALSASFEDATLKGTRIECEFLDNIFGHMGPSRQSQAAPTVTVKVRQPSQIYLVGYSTSNTLAAMVQRLNDKLLLGRRVRVQTSTGSIPDAYRAYFHVHSHLARIVGVPEQAESPDIAQFSGSKFVLPLRGCAKFDVDAAAMDLRVHLQDVGGRDGLVRLDRLPDDKVGGQYIFEAQFETWEQARATYNATNGLTAWWTMHKPLVAHLADRYAYHIIVSLRQYHAQQGRWDILAEAGNDVCTLTVIERKDRVSVRVAGQDRRAVGALKVRVEKLAAGHTLDVWHPGLTQAFLDGVENATGVYVQIDRPRKSVKIYADDRRPDNVERAQYRVRAEVRRLETCEHTVRLKWQSVRFFVRRGLKRLTDTFGEDAATLDVQSRPCTITIRGGTDMRHTLNALIKESLDVEAELIGVEASASSCPVCSDTVSSPVELGCGHKYCTPCVRHLLMSGSTLPLLCVAHHGEHECRRPIAVPDIERLVEPKALDRLLDTAIAYFIEHHPRYYKYCRTPGCMQIYRTSSRAQGCPRACPSCLADICCSCHEEAHPGMSCEERKMYDDPEEQERLLGSWADSTGSKRCGSCNVLIEKMDGCNHVACRCGVHICWICGHIFPEGRIYPHLHAAHGE